MHVNCPSCGATCDQHDFFCEACGEPLGGGAFDSSALKEISAWRLTPLTGEALILGDVSGEIQTLNAELSGDRGDSAFTLYTTSSEFLSPLAVLERTQGGDASDLTPYESYVLDLITGPMTVAELERQSPLAHEELNVSLLTLVDRGLLRASGGKARGSTAPLTRATAPPPPRPSIPAAQTAIAMPPRAGMPAPAPRAAMPPPTPAPTQASIPTHAAMPAPEPVRISIPAPGPAATRSDLRTDAPRRTVEVALPADHRHRGLIRERSSVPPPPSPSFTPAEAPKRPMSLNERKAAELAAAGKDELERGNVISARMNLKLALSFDPRNGEIQALFQKAAHAQEARRPDPRPKSRIADRLLAQSAEAEAKNDLPRAIQLLEQALQEGEDPVLLNRLGVILALKARQISRGQELLERALELDPKNATYSHNLGKVLSIAAERVESRRDDQKSGGSFWSKLKRK